MFTWYGIWVYGFFLGVLNLVLVLYVKFANIFLSKMIKLDGMITEEVESINVNNRNNRLSCKLFRSNRRLKTSDILSCAVDKLNRIITIKNYRDKMDVTALYDGLIQLKQNSSPAKLDPLVKVHHVLKAVFESSMVVHAPADYPPKAIWHIDTESEGPFVFEAEYKQDPDGTYEIKVTRLEKGRKAKRARVCYLSELITLEIQNRQADEKLLRDQITHVHKEISPLWDYLNKSHTPTPLYNESDVEDFGRFSES